MPEGLKSIHGSKVWIMFPLNANKAGRLGMKICLIWQLILWSFLAVIWVTHSPAWDSLYLPTILSTWVPIVFNNMNQLSSIIRFGRWCMEPIGERGSIVMKLWQSSLICNLREIISLVTEKYAHEIFVSIGIGDILLLSCFNSRICYSSKIYPSF